MTTTQILSRFISETKEIPPAVLDFASRLILDSVGCALGAITSEQAKVVTSFARSQGIGTESILGTDLSVPPVVAAYANGRLINILDQDETYLILGHHANAALGASLALANTCRLSGMDLLRAFTIGYEVGARAGNYMGVQLKVDRDGNVTGWNFPGPILGTYAACAAACVCLKLDAAQVENALGICAMYLPSNSGGIWEEGRRRSTLPTIKYEDCGFNTQAGLMAAWMAKSGITGTLGIFEQDVSLAQVAGNAPQANFHAITDGLGEDWRITRTSIKLWPSCRWFHYALTALDQAVGGKEISLEAIDRIDLYSASSCCLNASPIIGDNTEMDASFSVPHSAAMLLMGVPAGPDWFDPRIVYDKKTAALREKVHIHLHPALQKAEAWGDYLRWGQPDAPLKVPSRAVVTCGETVYEGNTEYALGDFWNEAVAPTEQCLKEKFITLAKAVQPGCAEWTSRMEQMANRLLHIGEEPSVSELLAGLRSN